MNAVSPFIPLGIMMVIVPAFYGLIIKFSARLLRHNEITWKKGFIFGIIVLIIKYFYRLLADSMGFSLPHVIGIIFGLIITLIIGGWFFSTRGKTIDGMILGWGEAIKLTGLSYVIFIALGKILIFMSKSTFVTSMP